MSARLAILKKSLEKKADEFDAKLQNHFESVAQANGQPLNDKRNGRATMANWDKQNNTLRNLNEGIKKTKAAIEHEEGKISAVECANEYIPRQILELMAQGVLSQWRKHPTTFFVAGVDEARIVWDEKKRVVAHRYASKITDPEARRKFASIYNSLNGILNKKTK